jgi:hypothetical protein
MKQGITHLTELTWPPLRAHNDAPLALNANETGNSPPLPMGAPSKLRSDGELGFTLNNEMVLDPALTTATTPALDEATTEC